MLSLSPEEIRLTPGDIARGKGDGFLIALNQLSSTRLGRDLSPPAVGDEQRQQPVLAVRPEGRPRGPAYSTSQFIRAWRRIALIMRGGPLAAINRKLRRLHMLQVRTSLGMLPRAPVSLMWVPLSFGNPEIPKNHPRFLWPGLWLRGLGRHHLVLDVQGEPGDEPDVQLSALAVQAVRVRRVGHLGPRRPGLRAAVLRVPALPQAACGWRSTTSPRR